MAGSGVAGIGTDEGAARLEELRMSRSRPCNKKCLQGQPERESRMPGNVPVRFGRGLMKPADRKTSKAHNFYLILPAVGVDFPGFCRTAYPRTLFVRGNASSLTDRNFTVTLGTPIGFHEF